MNILIRAEAKLCQNLRLHDVK